ncbi:MAG: DUF2141 domain-containing protein [Bacteroidota bacterium]
MKKLLIIILLLVPFSVLTAQVKTTTTTTTETGTLKVLVKGFKNTDGQLMIALYNSEGTFMGETPFRHSFSEIDAGEELISFDNLPYGNYAIAVIHDENDDGKLDKNELGIPKEGYGFSNDAMGKYGPPTWIQASFVFNVKELVKLVDIQYGIPN